jgi:hypothetical protein
VPQFLAHWGLALVAGGVLVLLVRTCAADLLTFGVALFWLAAAQPAAVLVQQPETVLRWNGVTCLAVAFLAGVFACLYRPSKTLSAAHLSTLKFSVFW